MASVPQHKKQILEYLWNILTQEDSSLPEEIEDFTKDYERWDKARNELAEEFLRRAGLEVDETPS